MVLSQIMLMILHIDIDSYMVMPLEMMYYIICGCAIRCGFLPILRYGQHVISWVKRDEKMLPSYARAHKMLLMSNRVIKKNFEKENVINYLHYIKG